MKKVMLLLSMTIFYLAACFAQETYKIGKTEYYYYQYYATTGKPMVKRSEANKSEFLKSKGYVKVPYGYEVDHIIPLSAGGTDDPTNMQLLTKEQHAAKTAYERSKNSNATYSPYPTYHAVTTYKPPKLPASITGSTHRSIYTGPNGGQYYINSNGNKSYLNSNINSTYTIPYYLSTPSYNYSAPNPIHTGPRGGQYYINSKGNKTY